MTVEIRETKLGGNLKPFLEVVEDIYRDDPNYVRPLDMDLKDRLSPKSPFFEHAQGTLFTAWREGRCVGRTTAHIDQEHLAHYRDDVGFFGLFDTVNDADVAKALLDRAGEWAAAHGAKALRGPMSLSVNEEIGCLVEGFDTPPMVMMPHHRSYQGGLIEAAGFSKIKDLFAWKYTIGQLPPRARRGHETIAAMPEIKMRQIDKGNLAHDVAIIMDIYNDAWSDNWGYVAMTRAELDKLAADLRLIVMPELTQIVSINDEPVAVAVTVPNLNEMIGDLHGKLLPFGLLKLLWRLKVQGPRSARVMILGIKRKLRGIRRYAALSTYMYVETHLSAERQGIYHGELSWTLEDNSAVNAGIRLMGGEIYKRYRLYQRSLSSA
ncbi:MAG: hypothetical protein HY898_30350 [Deltaproteobacteria bacterium]|nr:hypothetical protein [Deltaproteobacteria bacterium]